MGLNFAAMRAPVPAANTEKLPEANLWLNVGYLITVTMEDNSTQERFVSLPKGIPLDTMKPLNTTSNNEMYAFFQAARNDLLTQLVTEGNALPPGGEIIVALDTNTGLALQLRRVDEKKAPPTPGENMFSKRLNFSQN